MAIVSPIASWAVKSEIPLTGAILSSLNIGFPFSLIKLFSFSG